MFQQYQLLASLLMTLPTLQFSKYLVCCYVSCNFGEYSFVFHIINMYHDECSFVFHIINMYHDEYHYEDCFFVYLKRCQMLQQYQLLASLLLTLPTLQFSKHLVCCYVSCNFGEYSFVFHIIDMYHEEYSFLYIEICIMRIAFS